MSREEILLKEYEVCQSHNNASASHYWVTVGTFMGISTAILGGASIISGSISFSENFKWLVLGLGIAVIIITIFLMLWLKRVNFLIRINNYRMREIEAKLGMSKNSIVKYLDDLNQWETLASEEKGRLCELYKKRPCLQGHLCVKAIFSTVILLWVAFICMSFFLFDS